VTRSSSSDRQKGRFYRSHPPRSTCPPNIICNSDNYAHIVIRIDCVVLVHTSEEIIDECLARDGWKSVESLYSSNTDGRLGICLHSVPISTHSGRSPKYSDGDTGLAEGDVVRVVAALACSSIVSVITISLSMILLIMVTLSPHFWTASFLYMKPNQYNTDADNPVHKQTSGYLIRSLMVAIRRRYN
jgi:hypothetical protein